MERINYEAANFKERIWMNDTQSYALSCSILSPEPIPRTQYLYTQPQWSHDESPLSAPPRSYPPQYPLLKGSYHRDLLRKIHHTYKASSHWFVYVPFVLESGSPPMHCRELCDSLWTRVSTYAPYSSFYRILYCLFRLPDLRHLSDRRKQDFRLAPEEVAGILHLLHLLHLHNILLHLYVIRPCK